MAIGNTGSLGELIVSIGTDLSGLSKGLADAQKSVTRTAANITRTTDQIGRTFLKFGALVAAPLAFAGNAAVKFEDTFAGVRKTVDLSAEGFAQLSDNLKTLSTQIPTSVNDLNGIAEIAGQLGIDGVDNITKFTKTVAQIEASTNLSREAAATNFARIANVIQEPIENIDRMGAAVVDLGNNFATNESQILDFATRIAGAGKIANLTASDIFGIGAAFASVGVEAEAGGTAVQKVLNAMTEAAATGNDDLAVFAETAGLTVDEFIRLREEDPSEAFNRFVEGLQRAGDSSFKILADLGLSNERVIRAFLSVANAGDLLRRTLETSGSAYRDNTALQEEFAKRVETTKSQMAILFNTINILAIELGDVFLPIINDIVSQLAPVIARITEWARNNQEAAKNIVLLTAKIALLAIGLGIIIPLLGKVAAAIVFLGSPIGIVIAAVGLLATAWATNFAGIRDITKSVAVNIGRFLDSMIEKMVRATITIQEFSKIPLKARLLDPLGSLRVATDKATIGIRQLNDNGVIGGFEDKFGGAIDFAIDKTESFTDTIKETKAQLDSLFSAINGDGAQQGGGTDFFSGVSSPFDQPFAQAGQGAEQGAQDVFGSGGGGGEADKLQEQADARAAIERNTTDIIKKEEENRFSVFDAFFGKKQKSLENLNEMEKEAAERKRTSQQAIYDQTISNLESVLAQQAEGNKAAAIAFKAIKIKETVINTAEAIAEAAPNPILMAFAAAVGAAQVATIAGVQFAEGSDNVPVHGITDPGEIVVPASFADAIRKGRLTLGGPDGLQGGGGQGTVIENININISGNVTDDNVSRLAREIDREISLSTEQSLRGAT